MFKILKNDFKIFIKDPFALSYTILEILIFIALIVFSYYTSNFHIKRILPLFISLLIYGYIILPLVTTTRNTRWNYLVISSSIPCTRKDIVLSKYANLIVFIFILYFISFLSSIVTVALKKEVINISILKIFILNITVLSSTIGSIYYLLYFAIRNFYFFKSIVAIVFITTIFGSNLLSNTVFMTTLNNKLYHHFVLSLLLSFVIIIISMFISYKSFKNRDII